MSNFKDEIGNKYGRLRVLERAENSKEGRARWKCLCDCGKIAIVAGKHLRNGGTSSCGCYKNQRIVESNILRSENIINRKIGKLLVLRVVGFVEKNSGKRVREYFCRCDCGNTCLVQHQYLVSGDTQSCGCLKSKGEAQIETILKKYNIDFLREFSFPDLKDDGFLRFDFAIFNGMDLVKLIEFNGDQHYDNLNGYYNEKTVQHDQMKKDYCLKNQIPLLIIKYKRGRDICLEDLELEDLLDEL